MIFLTIIAYKSSTIKFILNFDHKNSNNLYLNNCPFIRVVIAGIKTYSRTYVSSKCAQRLHELFHAGLQSQLHQHGLKGAEIYRSTNLLSWLPSRVLTTERPWERGCVRTITDMTCMTWSPSWWRIKMSKSDWTESSFYFFSSPVSRF